MDDLPLAHYDLQHGSCWYITTKHSNIFGKLHDGTLVLHALLSNLEWGVRFDCDALFNGLDLA